MKKIFDLINQSKILNECLSYFGNRATLLYIECQMYLSRLKKTLLLWIMTLMCIQLSLFSLVVATIVYFWNDPWQPYLLIFIPLSFFLLSLVALFYAVRQGYLLKQVFVGTTNELMMDLQVLQGKNHEL